MGAYDTFGDTRRSINLPMKSAIYVWGYNHNWQTGRIGIEEELRVPKQLPPQLFGCPAGGNARWLDISCGREHTAAVASDGTLFTWGANEYGQLGNGSEKAQQSPQRVRSLDSEFVKSVCCGAFCTAAVAEPRRNDGKEPVNSIWVWGQNQNSNYPRLFFGAFAPTTNVKQVSCGAAHVVALSEGGLLQAWGYNESGQLGRGSACDGLQPAKLINSYAKFLDEPPENVTIVAVSCGEYHTAAVSDSNEVYTWGSGSAGQLGHTSLQSDDKELLPRRVVALDGVPITAIECGGVHTCAVAATGALYTWGGRSSSSLISSELDSFLRNIPSLILPSGVLQVSCGHSHTLLSMRDGSILGWGYNGYGQAAYAKSNYTSSPSPVDWCVGEVRKLAAGGGHSAVLTDAFSLKELCEYRIADIIDLKNASEIEDVALRTGADSLARLCRRIREYLLDGNDFD